MIDGTLNEGGVGDLLDLNLLDCPSPTLGFKPKILILNSPTLPPLPSEIY
jgi:hypothetical protein